MRINLKRIDNRYRVKLKTVPEEIKPDKR